jgi:hypothetical protein
LDKIIEKKERRDGREENRGRKTSGKERGKKKEGRRCINSR